MVGYVADAGRFFTYTALLNMFQVGNQGGHWWGGQLAVCTWGQAVFTRLRNSASCRTRSLRCPSAVPAAPAAHPQLPSETIGLLCALCTSASMYAVILLTFVSDWDVRCEQVVGRPALLQAGSGQVIVGVQPPMHARSAALHPSRACRPCVSLQSNHTSMPAAPCRSCCCS